jgi:hypothetical protein
VILRANVHLFCVFESLGAEELEREACPFLYDVCKFYIDWHAPLVCSMIDMLSYSDF